MPFMWCRFLFPPLLLAACASPEYRAPVPDAMLMAREKKAAITDAMETALARRARVYDLSWPILTENVDLCPETRPSIGVVIADRKMLARLAGGLREDDLEDIGVAEELIVVHAFAGSPAAGAGLHRGMKVLSVEGEAFSDSEEAVKKINQTTEEGGPVTLRIAEEGVERDFTITPVERCDMAVKISTSQAINAHAATGDVVVMTGAVRSLGDEGLKFLLAHEAAHLVAGHRRKYIQNAVVSGAVVAGPFLYGAGMVADRLAQFGDPPDVSFKARALKVLAPWADDFETEADYLGLYMYVRAGGDLDAARELFDVFSRETPPAIFVEATHPLTPERQARLAAAAREIEAKLAAGEDLMPETTAK